jgi:dCMP deaminase
MANHLLINDSTLETLKTNIEYILLNLTSKKERPTWDEYFMKVASLVAERATCLRHHIGAVIVKDKRIISTGYNGAARGVNNCLDLGCLRNALGIPSGTRHEICRAIHAEQNAIIQGAFHGTSLKDSVIYSTHTPCMICAKMIVNAGIKEVVSYHDYADEDARKFLQEAGVLLRKISKPIGIINFKD